jgi:hypothetical protein
VEALRAATLAGSSLAGVLPQLVGAFGWSAVVLFFGTLGLRRVEYLAKRAGRLELA